MRTRVEISAGGVIYRYRNGQPDVCLISTQGGKAWQLPKGIIEKGEPPEEAAQREVAEETGLRGELERRLHRIEYWYVWKEPDESVRVHKWVYFFLFKYIDGSTDDHDHEVDEARWVPLADAHEQLSFENEQEVLNMAAVVLDRGDA